MVQGKSQYDYINPSANKYSKPQAHQEGRIIKTEHAVRDSYGNIIGKQITEIGKPSTIVMYEKQKPHQPDLQIRRQLEMQQAEKIHAEMLKGAKLQMVRQQSGAIAFQTVRQQQQEVKPKAVTTTSIGDRIPLHSPTGTDITIPDSIRFRTQENPLSINTRYSGKQDTDKTSNISSWSTREAKDLAGKDFFEQFGYGLGKQSRRFQEKAYTIWDLYYKGEHKKQDYGKVSAFIGAGAYGIGEGVIGAGRHPIKTIEGMSVSMLTPVKTVKEIGEQFTLEPARTAGQFIGQSIVFGVYGKILTGKALTKNYDFEMVNKGKVNIETPIEVNDIAVSRRATARIEGNIMEDTRFLGARLTTKRKVGEISLDAKTNIHTDFNLQGEPSGTFTLIGGEKGTVMKLIGGEKGTVMKLSGNEFRFESRYEGKAFPTATGTKVVTLAQEVSFKGKTPREVKNMVYDIVAEPKTFQEMVRGKPTGSFGELETWKATMTEPTTVQQIRGIGFELGEKTKKGLAFNKISHEGVDVSDLWGVKVKNPEMLSLNKQAERIEGYISNPKEWHGTFEINLPKGRMIKNRYKEYSFKQRTTTEQHEVAHYNDLSAAFEGVNYLMPDKLHTLGIDKDILAGQYKKLSDKGLLRSASDIKEVYPEHKIPVEVRQEIFQLYNKNPQALKENAPTIFKLADMTMKESRNMWKIQKGKIETFSLKPQIVGKAFAPERATLIDFDEGLVAQGALKKETIPYFGKQLTRKPSEIHTSIIEADKQLKTTRAMQDAQFNTKRAKITQDERLVKLSAGETILVSKQVSKFGSEQIGATLGMKAQFGTEAFGKSLLKELNIESKYRNVPMFSLSSGIKTQNKLVSRGFLQEKQLGFSMPKQETIFKQMYQPKYKQTSVPKLSGMQIPEYKTDIMPKLDLMPKMKLQQQMKLNQSQIQMSKLETATIQKTKLDNFFFKVPKLKTPSPPIITDFIPSRNIITTKKGKKRKKSKGFMPHYTPTAFATAFNIKGKYSRGGELSGLGLRPIVMSRL